MSTKKRLLIVEASFQVSGRGLLIAPLVSPDVLGTSQNGYRAMVRLLRPDGDEEVAQAAFYWEHFNPGGFGYVCSLVNGNKGSVPSGTEIWLLDNES